MSFLPAVTFEIGSIHVLRNPLSLSLPRNDRSFAYSSHVFYGSRRLRADGGGLQPDGRQQRPRCTVRALGVFIPELDAIPGRVASFPYPPKHPILTRHIRPAPLAGAAIVEHAGPDMLRMLQGHIFGENRHRFIQVTDHLASPAIEWGPPRQMQLT